MDRRVHRSVPDLGARRVLAKIVVAFPVTRRPDGSGNKAAAAIGTDVAEDLVLRIIQMVQRPAIARRRSKAGLMNHPFASEH